MPKAKALLIGINYSGTPNELAGCIADVNRIREFLLLHGYSDDPRSMVILTDDQGGNFSPTGHNILGAMHWLVSGNRPGDRLFLHYSGHGGQVKDPDGDRESGYDSTIVPLDHVKNGQITSDALHKVLVSPLPRGVRMTVIFDCCHSGSAIELPYVYMADSKGNVNMLDNLKSGAQLAQQAYSLLQGGFNMQKVAVAKDLFAGAKTFFHSLHHEPVETNEDGVGEDHFVEDWKSEGRFVWMFSGCRDDQTSADSQFQGKPAGAMSTSFVNAIQDFYKQGRKPSYKELLLHTREIIRKNYTQVPQLSVGGMHDTQRNFGQEFDLDNQVEF